MGEVTTISVDLAKSVFRVHGVEAAGGVVARPPELTSPALPRLKRLFSCLLLGFGHQNGDSGD